MGGFGRVWTVEWVREKKDSASLSVPALDWRCGGARTPLFWFEQARARSPRESCGEVQRRPILHTPPSPGLKGRRLFFFYLFLATGSLLLDLAMY